MITKCQAIIKVSQTSSEGSRLTSEGDRATLDSLRRPLQWREHNMTTCSEVVMCMGGGGVRGGMTKVEKKK